jgi:hypothetical protein
MEGKDVMRRILACILPLCFTALAWGIQPEKPTGEPYRLAGKRLAFTNWYYIRPGQLDWVDREGNSVYSKDNVKAGRFEATLVHYDLPHGIRIVAEPAQSRGPVIEREKPWGQMGIRPTTLLHDEGKYRMWGTCQAEDGTDHTCYFESQDGIQWERPNLGIVEREGSTENNLLDFDKPVFLFKDPNGKPGEEYKAVWHGDFDPKLFEEYRKDRPYSVMATETDPGRFHSVLAAVSPDGLRWKRIDRAITVEPSDTNVVCYYDHDLEKYVLYTRNYMVGPRDDRFPNPTSRMHQFVFRRAIGRTESADFFNFPLSEVIVEPGPERLPTDTFYTNCKTVFPGAPDHHLLFPTIYHQDDDATSVEVQTSYDGKLWHRVPGSPILETAEEGEWDGGCVFATNDLVEFPNGDFALAYTGYLYPHKYPRGAWGYDIGMAVWPQGRMIALEAEEDGEFATIAVVAPGNSLKINALTQLAGEIKIEAADYEGTPLPGRSFEEADPIRGSQYNTPVTWGGESDLGIDPGEAIILRFRMNQAKLYYLEFE